MNILLLGSGGREHALAWAISASPLTARVICAPGNAGIAQVAECVALDLGDHKAVIAFAKENKIDLVVVGPEGPLVAGIVDDLEAAGVKAFGPNKWAARLEGSKGFTKDLCKANNIPTAAYQRFKQAQAAKDYVRKQGAPIVVKADGLAAGKGVVVAETVQEAEAAIDMMFGGGLGSPAWEIVIEECLVGEEASFFALCDGETALPLVSAQDHKRVGDGDEGPNTGGMGAYSPVPVAGPEIIEEAMAKAVRPTLDELRLRGIEYRGILYAGLMLTKDGVKVIEYNVRFGDPECQVVIPRLTSDLFRHCLEAASGRLTTEVNFSDDACVSVVAAVEGYPVTARTGDPITGIDAANQVEGVTVFHAGTARSEADPSVVVTAGGRVLDVTATAPTLHGARARAYEAMDRISWPGMHYRRDIAGSAA